MPRTTPFSSSDGFEPFSTSSASVSLNQKSALLLCHTLATPELPLDGAMTFELIVFAYSMVAMMLQLLHLYRSVFWLPHSYNNNAVVRKDCFYPLKMCENGTGTHAKKT